MQVSRDTLGTKSRVRTAEQVNLKALATRRSPHPPLFPCRRLPSRTLIRGAESRRPATAPPLVAQAPLEARRAAPAAPPGSSSPNPPRSARASGGAVRASPRGRPRAAGHRLLGQVEPVVVDRALADDRDGSRSACRPQPPCPRSAGRATPARGMFSPNPGHMNFPSSSRPEPVHVEDLRQLDARRACRSPASGAK